MHNHLPFLFKGKTLLIKFLSSKPLDTVTTPFYRLGMCLILDSSNALSRLFIICLSEVFDTDITCELLTRLFHNFLTDKRHVKLGIMFHLISCIPFSTFLLGYFFPHCFCLIIPFFGTAQHFCYSRYVASLS